MPGSIGIYTMGFNTIRQTVLLYLLLVPLILSAQDSTKTDTRSVLLHQLRTTHTIKDWFVPVKVALEGVTAEQASWTDGSGNHSIGQLAHHLIFWNERLLIAFNGDEPPVFSGDNEETFNAFDRGVWIATQTKLDSVLNAWEEAIARTGEEKLQSWYENLANINTHNAYHTGQIVYIRKLQGSWDPVKGVK